MSAKSLNIDLKRCKGALQIVKFKIRRVRRLSDYDSVTPKYYVATVDSSIYFYYYYYYASYRSTSYLEVLAIVAISISSLVLVVPWTI